MAGHVFLLAALYSLLYTVGLLNYAPGSTSIIQWDAGWYDSIRDHGYVFTEGANNIPFFPLFPYLWRLLGVEGIGISIVNLGILLLGAVWLGRTFSMRRGQVLLLLSLPPVFFCLVPYAEALFFLFGAILLRGLHRQHLPLTVLGLLGCGLSRSSATLVVPVFAITEVLACTSRADIPRLAGRLTAGLLATGMALGLVMYLHYEASGNALAFFEVHKYWGHEPHWPLPYHLHSTGGLPILWLDAMALLVGLTSLGVGLTVGVRWLLNCFQRNSQYVSPSRAVIFSLGYCAAAMAFILVYQNKFGQGGDLVDGSRYVFATPFFGVLLAQLRNWPHWEKRVRWLLAGGLAGLALAVAFWLGWPFRFPGFLPGEASWLFVLWAAYIAAYAVAMIGTWRYSREINAVLYTVNLVYQAFLLNLFLGAVWIG